jgi:hypothetical protein
LLPNNVATHLVRESLQLLLWQIKCSLVRGLALHSEGAINSSFKFLHLPLHRPPAKPLAIQKVKDRAAA